MNRVIAVLATFAALGNAFAPVAAPRAAVRLQVGVPRIYLPAQVVQIQRP